MSVRIIMVHGAKSDGIEFVHVENPALARRLVKWGHFRAPSQRDPVHRDDQYRAVYVFEFADPVSPEECQQLVRAVDGDGYSALEGWHFPGVKESGPGWQEHRTGFVPAA